MQGARQPRPPTAAIEITPHEETELKVLDERLREHAHDWNEVCDLSTQLLEQVFGKME